MDKANLKQKLPRKPYIGQRSLLQVDEENADQEELGYEDLKEVLADDKEDHDDMDGHGRNKRDDVTCLYSNLLDVKLCQILMLLD